MTPIRIAYAKVAPGAAQANFNHAIPNIPGKSLVAVVVVYAPGGARARTRMPSRPSSTPTSSRAPSSLR
jgi:hypothetical protein